MNFHELAEKYNLEKDIIELNKIYEKYFIINSKRTALERVKENNETKFSEYEKQEHITLKDYKNAHKEYIKQITYMATKMGCTKPTLIHYLKYNDKVSDLYKYGDHAKVFWQTVHELEGEY